MSPTLRSRSRFSGGAGGRGKVTVVRHEIKGHHVSGALKEAGELAPLVQRQIAGAANAVLDPAASAVP